MIFDEFLLRTLVGGAGVALATGPLGCFVVWRRLAYFGEAMAHAAVLGVALSLASSLPMTAGVLVATVAAALLVAWLGRGIYGPETVLAVVAHAALGLGLLAVSMLPGRRIDLEAYLFGDILAITWQDAALIWAGALALLGFVLWRWRALLTAAVNVDLAAAEGIGTGRDRLALTLALAALVALAIKVVGALLIVALLIVPAAAARPLAATPERMAVLATSIGAGATVGGIFASHLTDVPAGPAIVTAAALAFAVTNLLAALHRR